MSRNPQLKFLEAEVDGQIRRHVRLGHGAKCVLILIEDEDYRLSHGYAVLAPATARSLGRALIRQANASEAVA